MNQTELKKAIILGMIQALVIELRSSPQNFSKKSLMDLESITTAYFRGISDEDRKTVETIRDKAWYSLESLYTDSTVDVGLPTLIETLYFSAKDQLDEVGKSGHILRCVNSIARKMHSEYHENSYNIVDKFIVMLDRIINEV